MNNQSPLQISTATDGNMLLVHSIFRTIQGEGPLSGRPAVFIRLGGCNLQCPGCDTEYTEGSRFASTCEIIGMVTEAIGVKLVVITGGEPFRQNITPLANKLHDMGYTVQVETNGTIAPVGNLNRSVVIVCSPKTPKISKYIRGRASSFKYVISAHSISKKDGLPLNVLGLEGKPVARPVSGTPVFIHAMDTGDALLNSENMKACVGSSIVHQYTVQVQAHKILGVE